MTFPIEKIEAMIYTVRGERVMLDRDLAKLYGIETFRLNEAVKRNIERFPSDFLIIPDSSELASLRSQIAILDRTNSRNLVFRNSPNLFTENGVAMLSSILNSKEAIQINITIMRTFTKLRSFLSMEQSLSDRTRELEVGMTETHKVFKLVFEKLDQVEEKLNFYVETVTPKISEKRKKIGLKKD